MHEIFKHVHGFFKKMHDFCKNMHGLCKPMYDFCKIMHEFCKNTSHVNFIQKIWRVLLVVKVIFSIAHMDPYGPV